MSDLGPANKLVCSESNSDEDSDCDDANTLEDASPHLKSLDEAISYLGDICNFLEDKGYTREANSSHALWQDFTVHHKQNRLQSLIILNDSATLIEHNTIN